MAGHVSSVSPAAPARGKYLPSRVCARCLPIGEDRCLLACAFVAFSCGVVVGLDEFCPPGVSADSEPSLMAELAELPAAGALWPGKSTFVSHPVGIVARMQNRTSIQIVVINKDDQYPVVDGIFPASAIEDVWAHWHQRIREALKIGLKASIMLIDPSGKTPTMYHEFKLDD